MEIRYIPSDRVIYALREGGHIDEQGNCWDCSREITVWTVNKDYIGSITLEQLDQLRYKYMFYTVGRFSNNTFNTQYFWERSYR